MFFNPSIKWPGLVLSFCVEEWKVQHRDPGERTERKTNIRWKNTECPSYRRIIYETCMSVRCCDPSKSSFLGLPCSPLIRTLPFSPGEVVSIPGWGGKIPHALQSENQNIKKKKQYCNKFNKDLKTNKNVFQVDWGSQASQSLSKSFVTSKLLITTNCVLGPKNWERELRKEFRRRVSFLSLLNTDFAFYSSFSKLSILYPFKSLKWISLIISQKNHD